jgi:hypothetical protein
MSLQGPETEEIDRARRFEHHLRRILSAYKGMLLPLFRKGDPEFVKEWWKREMESVEESLEELGVQR